MHQMIETFHSAKEISDELILRCSDRCIEKNSATEGILKLKELAKDCETKADYINFFANTLRLNAIESERGIVLHLGKKMCTCPMASELQIDRSRLCDCTKEHEKKMWSLFFGVPIDIEILESFWRGGSDCVLEIVF